ncbi:MAG: response regulator [Bosea sp.]|uniref:response regulator n=1 Tax=unclassified Bosea (in: a-proteobacteria) TaxID=2653178 RepID=UPI00096052F8|nr:MULTISPECIES: response regulator [unclassified Bosea (in: a-proteobacteria)]MBN9455080.1 response regulator [Bosea sp. (in: a-proteobacteria)]OJV04741.1 MAG: two-component system sensor histidine kinase/response regulator [Bosea sp. 67-29]
MPNRPINVLYIDDDATLGRLVQRMLGRHNYVVEHVETAEAGLSRAQEGGVDVIILDHDLGSASGLDVLADLAEHASAPAVIYVTASSELSIAVTALKAGAMDYVVKTVGEDFEVLLRAALEHAVVKTRLTRAREQAELEVRAARDRAVTLLAEVNHRVANSLSLVGSLVRMQAGSVEDPGAKAALAETQARITAIGNLHRSLYTSDDVRTVELASYLRSLLEEFARSMSGSGRMPTVSFEAEPILTKTDKAISIGLIATELVTNALKYAYPDGQGEVRVRLSRVDDKVALEVADDGIGWTGTGAIKGTGLGSKIVSAMARSLATELRYEQREGRGTHAVMELSLSGLAPPEAADG